MTKTFVEVLTESSDGADRIVELIPAKDWHEACQSDAMHKGENGVWHSGDPEHDVQFTHRILRIRH